MTCKTTFELHHNFPKLAEESGFTFNTHKPKVHIEWRKIKLIDIENVIRDRKFIIVEQHINDVLDCVLESEFDVRILDEGFLKIFRLAQLAVEYQQFCRHYLDRSVFVLREEVTNLMQELEITKKNLREKEEEQRKLRKKSKHFARTPLPYGNENIAAMILKTLNQSKGDIFNSTSQLDAMQYNKCRYCEKVFLNQLYLQGHISRRHGDVLDIPQRDTPDNHPTIDHTNNKLNNEVSELKLKIKQMEELIEDSKKKSDLSTEHPTAEVNAPSINNKEPTKIENHETKDPEVVSNEEGFILEKIEEWKKEEHDKYNEEIKLLRQQIIDIIGNKEKQDQTAIKSELKMIEELHATIKLQGDEILTLKHKLLNEESVQVEKRKEIEIQMSYWIKQAEMQSNEYKSLLQKLNEAANEAKEYRAQARTEKEKADQLQLLLQRQQNNSSPEHSKTKHKSYVIENPVEKVEVEHQPVRARNTHRTPTADVITLRKLQQKAQELLNIDESSTSDNSKASDVKLKPKTKLNKEANNINNTNKQKYTRNKYNQTTLTKVKKNLESYEKTDDVHRKKIEDKKSKNKSKTDSQPTKKENGFVNIPASPLKVVRAKITEEVNNRLISLGVDPLKNRISESIFRKQRKILQEQQQAKTKKTPSREKILHSIMTHLDQNTSSTSNIQESNYISPKKYPKTFSISSVLSNVKTKALSLVKSTENSNKYNKSHDELAKTAIALLKTPPGSNNSSPVMQRRYSVASSDNNSRDIIEEKKSKQKSRIILKNNFKGREENNEESTESSEESDYTRDEDKQNIDSTSKIINNLIKSPARRPADNNNVHNHAKYKREFTSDSNIDDDVYKHFVIEKDKNSSDGIEYIKDISPKKNTSSENINPKHTKGVLKNASSTSSLNKKKVLFDMEAIQMKSVSASPSQSVTDKSDKNGQYELGIVNLDTEEWDISSIENEPLKTTTNIQISTRTSPKIAELKQTIESQLTRRNPNLATAITGGVDVLSTPIQKASFGGSNTSLGSSILDDDSSPIPNHNTLVKPKKVTEKDDSEIEISDLLADTIANKSYNKSF